MITDNLRAWEKNYTKLFTIIVCIKSGLQGTWSAKCPLLVHCRPVHGPLVSMVRSADYTQPLTCTTGRQIVIYYSTNHAQELIYFDSNTSIENSEKVIVSLGSSNFPPSHKEIQSTVLPVMLMFTCISYITDSRKKMLDWLKLWQRRLMSAKYQNYVGMVPDSVTRFRQINHWFSPLPM